MLDEFIEKTNEVVQEHKGERRSNICFSQYLQDTEAAFLQYMKATPFLDKQPRPLGCASVSMSTSDETDYKITKGGPT